MPLSFLPLSLLRGLMRSDNSSFFSTGRPLSPRPQSRDTGWDGFAQIAQYFHNILMLIPLTGRKLVQNG